MQKWDHKYEGVSCSRVFNSLQPHGLQTFLLLLLSHFNRVQL